MMHVAQDSAAAVARPANGTIGGWLCFASPLLFFFTALTAFPSSSSFDSL